jgi:hypothetical protein
MKNTWMAHDTEAAHKMLPQMEQITTDVHADAMLLTSHVALDSVFEHGWATYCKCHCACNTLLAL